MDYIAHFANETLTTRTALNAYVSTGVAAIAHVATLVAQIAVNNRHDHIADATVPLLTQKQIQAIITGTPDGRFVETVAKDKQRNECLLAATRLAMRYTSDAHRIDAPLDWLTGNSFAACVTALHTHLAVAYPSVRAVQNLVANASHTAPVRDDIKRLSTALANALKDNGIAPHNIATLADSLSEKMDSELFTKFATAIAKRAERLDDARKKAEKEAAAKLAQEAIELAQQRTGTEG